MGECLGRLCMGGCGWLGIPVPLSILFLPLALQRTVMPGMFV